MLKKTIKYTNPFTNQEVTEDHYFHISKADIVELQMENAKEPEVLNPATGEQLDGYLAMVQRMINAEDTLAVLGIVKDLVKRSYGRKVGDSFIKSAEVWKEFSGTEAYSELLFELSTDEEKSAEFINGIFPREIVQEAKTLQGAKPADIEGNGTPVPEGPKLLTQAEMTEMDSDELKAGLATGRYKLS